MSVPVDAVKAIRAHLRGYSALTDLVGENIVALGVFTEYENPCVVIGLQGGETNRNLLGDEDEQNPELQLDCYAPAYATAKQIHDLVYDRLSSISRVTVGGHLILSCVVDQPRDDSEPLLPGQAVPDYLFIHTARPWLQRV
jgi:hypothetical protein